MNEVAERCRISMIMFFPFQCLGKLRRDPEEEPKDLNHHQHQRNAQRITRSALTKLLQEVQVRVHTEGCELSLRLFCWDVSMNSIQSQERKIKCSPTKLTCALCVLVAGREAGLEWIFCCVFEFRHWAGGAEQAAAEESGASQLFSKRSPCRRGPEWVSECVAP